MKQPLQAIRLKKTSPERNQRGGNAFCYPSRARESFRKARKVQKIAMDDKAIPLRGKTIMGKMMRLADFVRPEQFCSTFKNEFTLDPLRVLASLRLWVIFGC